MKKYSLHTKERILLIGSNIWNFADGMLGPLLAVFTERIGGDILEITWAWAIYLFATGLMVIVVGKISDKYSKEKLMVAGYALTSIFTFSYIFVENPIHLFLVQAGLGIALALCNPTWMALYDKYSDNDNDGYIWGLADGQTKMVTALAIIIGGNIVHYLSFATLFIVMGIIQICATIYQAQILRQEQM